MKRNLFFTTLLMVVATLVAQPDDAAHLDWESEIPRVIYPDEEFVQLYEKTWAIAADRVRIGPEGLPASPYLDENCYEDQIWIWDACFMVMFSKYAPLAYPGRQTLDNLYLPVVDNQPTPLRVHLRDNPPLFAWTEYQNFVFSGDSAHINEVLYKKNYLQRHFNYFNTVEKGNVNEAISPNPIRRGLVKDDKGELIGYTWTGGASGMDNTPRGREAGGYNNIAWIDAISQQALSALCISRLYQKTGDKKLAAQWLKEYKRIKKIVNDRYWDEEDGYYYDVSVADGSFCRIKTPASFWAMMAEIPSKEQAERMVQSLRNPNELGGKYPWVSLSREDQDYNGETGDYWRGGIWLPMVYMGTKALEKYGYYDLADSLAANVIRQQLRTYQTVTPHTIWECYSPVADSPSTEYGNRARPDFCGWSALGPISLFIENVLGFRAANALEKRLDWSLKSMNGTHGIKNLKFGSIVTDVVYDAEAREVKVVSNEPYTLRINNKNYLIDKGDTVLKINNL